MGKKSRSDMELYREYRAFSNRRMSECLTDAICLVTSIGWKRSDTIQRSLLRDVEAMEGELDDAKDTSFISDIESMDEEQVVALMQAAAPITAALYESRVPPFYHWKRRQRGRE